MSEHSGGRAFTPDRALRLARWGVLAALAFLVLARLPPLRLVTVAADDRSTPEAGPGTRLLVLPAANREPVVESLYLMGYEGPDGALTRRLVRLVGKSGEEVERDGGQVRVGGRLLSIPAEEAREWPPVVPPGHCLLLTDEPVRTAPDAWLHPDSRTLGPLPVDRLLERVVAVLPF